MRLLLLLPLLLVLTWTPAAEAAPSLPSAPIEAVISLPDLFGVDLDDVLKAGGVVLVVNEYGEEINKFINQLLDNNDASTNAATKVVVIVSPQGKYIGAAQVTGPQAAVEKVKAVAQLEKKFKAGIRVRAMIPIASDKATDFKRVQGVAVSAVIDIKL